MKAAIISLANLGRYLSLLATRVAYFSTKAAWFLPDLWETLLKETVWRVFVVPQVCRFELQRTLWTVSVFRRRHVSDVCDSESRKKRVRGIILRRTEYQQQPAQTSSCCESSMWGTSSSRCLSFEASYHLSDCSSSKWDSQGHIRCASIWKSEWKQVKRQ